MIHQNTCSWIDFQSLFFAVFYFATGVSTFLKIESLFELCKQDPGLVVFNIGLVIFHMHLKSQGGVNF